MSELNIKTLNIKTDHKWKQFKYAYEIPKKARKDLGLEGEEFDFQNCLKYLNTWYTLNDFIRFEGDMFPKPWNGYHPLCYFFGVIIEIAPDGEGYRIGNYCS